MGPTVDSISAILILICYIICLKVGVGTGVLAGAFIICLANQLWYSFFLVLMVACVYWLVRLIETRWLKDAKEQRIVFSIIVVLFALMANHLMSYNLSEELYALGDGRITRKLFSRENRSAINWVSTCFILLAYVSALLYRRSKVDEWLGKVDPDTSSFS